ncbi:Asp23/Gls24 family envelope stress response protein [Oceanithermus sp.]
MVDYELSDSAIVETISLTLESIEGVRLASAGARSVGDVLSGRRSRPVRVVRENGRVRVELQLVARYGEPLKNLAENVQRSVYDVLTATTGLKVEAVDVVFVDVTAEGEDAA